MVQEQEQKVQEQEQEEKVQEQEKEEKVQEQEQKEQEAVTHGRSWLLVHMPNSLVPVSMARRIMRR